MSDTDDAPTNIIPQKPPPPPRREAGEPLHPSDPIEMPEPVTPPAETPLAPTQPREASPSRPPASRRERQSGGRVVIPPRDSDPEIISRRNVVPIGRAANITTAALTLASGDFEPHHLHFPGPITRRR
jgi:hypothetical protein